MAPILMCMIIGLAISIERIITLNLATTNTKKLLGQIEDALSKGGVNAALDVTRNTRGPVASIFTQGLMRYHEGIDMVEKSIVSYGGVEMGRLERGLIWISLVIHSGQCLVSLGLLWGWLLRSTRLKKLVIFPHLSFGWYEGCLDHNRWWFLSWVWFFKYCTTTW